MLQPAARYCHRVTIALLSIVLLVGMTACRTAAPPEIAPSTGTSSLSSPEPGGSPTAVEPSDSAEDPGAKTPDADSGSEAATPEDPIDPSSPDNTGITRITVTLDSEVVLKGTILDPVVTVLPDSAADKSCTLSSGDESIVRQVYGFWTAVGGGSTEIIATSASGVTGSVTVTVIVPLEAISLSASEITLNRGDSVTLKPIFTPADTTDTRADYTSGDEDISSVTDDGTVLAIGAGTTIIQCTIGEFSASCTVTVIVPTTGISVSTDRRMYKVGDRGSFTVQISPQDATDKTFSAEVSNTAIILTDTNSFSCAAGGEATITVTAANGMTASQTITVIDLVAYANEVFRLTNAEREKAGLEPLSMMSSLTQTAVVRANEITRSFSHDRPDGSDCFTAFDDNNVPYQRAGENIAMGQRTPTEVVRAWMDSAGHRENILNEDFGHLGVGVAMDSSGRLYWAQNFTD